MTVIELPDRQAKVLTARAAALGLTLKEWLRRLADEEAMSFPPLAPREAAARILQLQLRVKPDPEGWTVHDYIDRDRP